MGDEHGHCDERHCVDQRCHDLDALEAVGVSSSRGPTAESSRHQRQNNGDDVAQIVGRVREQGQAARQDAAHEFSQRDGRVESGAGPESPVQPSVAGERFVMVTHGDSWVLAPIAGNADGACRSNTASRRGSRPGALFGICVAHEKGFIA